MGALRALRALRKLKKQKIITITLNTLIFILFLIKIWYIKINTKKPKSNRLRFLLGDVLLSQGQGPNYHRR